MAGPGWRGTPKKNLASRVYGPVSGSVNRYKVLGGPTQRRA